MQAIKGLWILLAIVLFSSATFGTVSVPMPVGAQQAVVATVLQVLDGAVPDNGVLPGWAGLGRIAAPADQEPAVAGHDAENARLAPYLALHKAQPMPR